MIQLEYLKNQHQSFSKAMSDIKIDFQKGLELKTKLDELEKTQVTHLKLLNERQKEIVNLIIERNILREETKEMLSIKASMVAQRAQRNVMFRFKVMEFSERSKSYKEQIEDLVTKMSDEKNQYRLMTEERDCLKQHFSKMMARQSKWSNSDQRICKLCSKEYSEKENFNWSCRIHTSDWGGEMWWCCGKRGKENTGCKFQKHQIKTNAEVGIEVLLSTNERQLKCLCC